VSAFIKNEVCWLRINKKDNVQDVARWLKNLNRLPEIYRYWQFELHEVERTLEHNAELQSVVEAGVKIMRRPDSQFSGSFVSYPANQCISQTLSKPTSQPVS